MMMMRRRRGRRFRTIDCPICTESVRETSSVNMRCCSKYICSECMGSYCSEQINEGIFKIGCIFPECDKKLDHGLVMNNLAAEKQKKLFEKMIIDSTSDPHIKTCPGCSKAEIISDENLVAIDKSKSWFSTYSSKATHIKCDQCDLEWCFSCHAPWHKGITCSTYLKGDKAFNQWMYWKAGATINAHFCPKCRIPIQRSSGCPSMVCSFCNVSWCYDCGQSKAWDNTMLGPHYSKIAFKGCLTRSYLFNNSLVITYIIRTAFLLLMLLGFIALGLFVAIIGIPLFPLILLTVCTVFPLYGGVLYKEKPIMGTTPYNIFNHTTRSLIKLFMAIAVLVLFVLMAPVAILAGTTLIPLVLFYSKFVRNM